MQHRAKIAEPRNKECCSEIRDIVFICGKGLGGGGDWGVYTSCYGLARGSARGFGGPNIVEVFLNRIVNISLGMVLGT